METILRANAEILSPDKQTAITFSRAGGEIGTILETANAYKIEGTLRRGEPYYNYSGDHGGEGPGYYKKGSRKDVGCGLQTNDCAMAPICAREPSLLRDATEKNSHAMGRLALEISKSV